MLPNKLNHSLAKWNAKLFPKPTSKEKAIPKEIAKQPFTNPLEVQNTAAHLAKLGEPKENRPY